MQTSAPLLPLKRLAGQIDAATAVQAATLVLDHDWSGARAAIALRFGLALDDSSLWLSAVFDQSSSGPPGAPAGFVEELWQHDVVELFVAHPHGAYQELNLSPEAAWWAASFSSYRERSPLPPPSGSAWSFARDGAKCAVLRVPLGWFMAPPAEGTRANVTAILGTNPRTYLSWAALPGERPDFHRTGPFSALTLVSG